MIRLLMGRKRISLVEIGSAFFEIFLLTRLHMYSNGRVSLMDEPSVMTVVARRIPLAGVTWNIPRILGTK